MRRILGFAIAAGLWTAAPTFASEPPTSSTAAASTETATPAAADQKKSTTDNATSTSPSATSATAATSSDATQVKLTAGDDDAAAQLKRFKAAGYKPEVHNGSVVFCRSETQMGSRFERKVCTTAHLLELQIARAQSTMTETQRKMTAVPFGN